MNPAATSKEALLAAAREIVRTAGPEGLNIRRLAAACGISVGAVYHYFPSKGELLVALVEDFWRRIPHDDFLPAGEAGFAECIEEIYRRLSARLEEFRAAYLGEIARLPPELRERGRAVERVYWDHMKRGLLLALARDRRVCERIWSARFTREGFVDFVFCSLMSILRGEGGEIAFLREVVERLLYQS